jgi:hypothetical protein
MDLLQLLCDPRAPTQFLIVTLGAKVFLIHSLETAFASALVLGAVFLSANSGSMKSRWLAWDPMWYVHMHHICWFSDMGTGSCTWHWICCASCCYFANICITWFSVFWRALLWIGLGVAPFTMRVTDFEASFICIRTGTGYCQCCFSGELNIDMVGVCALYPVHNVVVFCVLHILMLPWILAPYRSPMWWMWC